jgi:hypothetical protein
MLLRQAPLRIDSEAMPFEWLAVAVLLAYAVREPFAGAVQYYLDQLHLGFLWFLPDAIGLICVAALVVIDLVKFGSFKFPFFLCAIFYYMLLGYVSIGSAASSFSGFKALLPLFAGLMLSRPLLQRNYIQIALTALLLLAMAGVWWSLKNTLPWAQLSFDSGLGVKQLRSTIWAAGGTYRPFGFASDPHSAGSSIVFLFALIGAGNARLLFYGLSVPVAMTVWASTSRTSFMALAILLLLRFVLDVLEKRDRPRLTELVTAVVPFLVICAPMCVMAFAQMYSANDVPGELFSLWVRGNEVFLQPFTLMPMFAPNAWLFGFGLGGVGFPVIQSNYASYSSIIDNFLLFSYYSFGIPFLIFYFAMCLRNRLEADFYKRILFCVTLIFGQFILGWANGMFMIVFGYAASASFLGGLSLRSPTLVGARS